MPDDQHADEARHVKASFAGWKLDVLDALCADKRLQASDFRVAHVLLQHLNARDWRTFPGQPTIAEITGMSVRNVAKCLARLRDAGWICWERGSHRKSNEYTFSPQTVAEALAAAKAKQAARKARKVKA
jgi:DNA-binding MarR family transcriptional regulator